MGQPLIRVASASPGLEKQFVGRGFVVDAERERLAVVDELRELLHEQFERPE